MHRICQPITRPKSEAAILRQPATSKHWRSSRAAARKLMERKLGRKLLPTEDVHHINRDYTDNHIENLEVLNEVDHAKLHHPKNPVPRSRRPERIAYLKAYNEKRKTLKTICATCKKEFLADRYWRPKHCSNSCAQVAKWRKRRA